MPPATEGEGESEKMNPADWLYSDARQRIMQDMVDGIVPINERIENTRRLFDELYAHLPEFERFPYRKDLYDTRIKSLQGIVKRHVDNAKRDADAFAHDRARHPQQFQNNRGEPLWRDSEADRWLKIDMANNKHVGVRPSVLRAERACYQQFSKRRFAKRIDQLKEKAKPFGKTPGQAKSEKIKVKNIREKSRRSVLDPYVNEADDL